MTCLGVVERVFSGCEVMAMSSKDGTFCLGAAVWNLDGGEVMTISCNDYACWGETRAGGGKGDGCSPNLLVWWLDGRRGQGTISF